MAKTLSEIFGEEFEVYLGVAAEFKNENVEQIVERLLE